MMYRVARASEFLVITGIGINELKITKKALVWPLQKCRIIDVTPVNYTFEVNAMSAEKLPFLLPAVFTIGPCVDDRERLNKYAKLLSHHERDSHDVKDLVQGVIEGETRVLAASMTMEEIFKGTKDFKKEVFDKVQLELNQFGLLIYNANIKQLVDVQGHEYFSYLGQKTQMEAANQAKIDVSEARMKGEIGAKEREGLTRQNAAKIDAETKIISTQRDGDGKKEEVKVKTDVKIYENQREAEVAEANSVLATKKAGWSQQAKMAEIEAQKAVAIREAVLQQEVERKNALTKTESLKAQHLSKATVDYEIKVQEANSVLYKKQKEAEAVLYENRKTAEAKKLAAEAQTYAVQLAADAALYAEKKEAEGLKGIAEAEGVYVRSLMSALGGNYNALRDYMMIEKGMFKDIAKFNAEAIKGLQPKISIWSNGGTNGQMVDGTSSGHAGIKELASIYQALPPLLETVHEQTGMSPPAWMGSLSVSANPASSSQSA
ncbi:flotillin-like protein 6 [Solanum lycopersicum]|uniref:flotillin-like protein 6 n=1 Tax=Solanum lycopersicum TaxID=4081 RepID=UPI0002761B5F|nr:flotillin-like protein 6 [Solanum lycopersicum]XP_010325209.1 flotillin-like protein 6 [Solanum lycopersicum]XP_019071260.1 flotillin-like protein 6 [Solanum lycopersicum]XP_019071261.1 flotillin-like protein 6 [Solanum lycopersicum]